MDGSEPVTDDTIVTPEAQMAVRLTIAESQLHLIERRVAKQTREIANLRTRVRDMGKLLADARGAARYLYESFNIGCDLADFRQLHPWIERDPLYAKGGGSVSGNGHSIPDG